MNFYKLLLLNYFFLIVFIVNVIIMYGYTSDFILEKRGEVDIAMLKKSYSKAVETADIEKMDQFTDHMIDVYQNQRSLVKETIGAMYFYTILLVFYSLLVIALLHYINIKVKKIKNINNHK